VIGRKIRIFARHAGPRSLSGEFGGLVIPQGANLGKQVPAGFKFTSPISPACTGWKIDLILFPPWTAFTSPIDSRGLCVEMSIPLKPSSVDFVVRELGARTKEPQLEFPRRDMMAANQQGVLGGRPRALLPVSFGRSISLKGFFHGPGRVRCCNNSNRSQNRRDYWLLQKDRGMLFFPDWPDFARGHAGPWPSGGASKLNYLAIYYPFFFF